MADENKARLTQIDGYPEYCRRYKHAGGYDDYDDEVHAYDGTYAALWDGAASIMYWGSASKFNSMGFRKQTAPVVGTITWEYSKGGGLWQAFDANNPFQNSTAGLTQDGLIAWQDPPDTVGAVAWAKNTVDGQEAYWIRASIASHTTTGYFYNFLRNALLRPPVRLKPEIPAGRVFRDLGSTLRKTDLAYDGPTRLTIHVEQIATVDGDSDTMPNLTLLWYWFDNRCQLFIDDLAQTSVPNLTTDAYFKDYTTRFAHLPGEMESPYKMLPDGGYELAFEVDACTRIAL